MCINCCSNNISIIDILKTSNYKMQPKRGINSYKQIKDFKPNDNVIKDNNFRIKDLQGECHEHD